jgi:acyl carrier protein
MASFVAVRAATNADRCSVSNNIDEVKAAGAGPVRQAIISQIEQIAKEQKKALHPLTDDLVLLDSGLDSLCLAILVARLDEKFGFDPFSTAEDEHLPVTLRDFIRLYEVALD